eukprot:m.182974 g.182974  ORF g.182974 m.182974 type:complete len:581 (+) comp32140_c0_seq2:152-1894(+)
MVKYFNIYEDTNTNDDVPLLDYGSTGINSSQADDDISSPTTKPHDTKSFGKKSIGTFAGVALLVNNITGPGVPQLPNLFAESGWLVPVVLFLIVWAMSSLSATMYCEAMRRIPGNEHFRGRAEYTSIAAYYFGRSGYIAAQIGLNGALQSLNIVSVMQSAQVMDRALAEVAGQSCGINISPFTYYSENHTAIEGGTSIWNCVDTEQLSAIMPNPWGCHLIVSAGYLITLGMAIPAGIFNLDDNMILQVIAFGLTICCWLIWLSACFFTTEDPDYNTAFTNWTLDAINTNDGYGSQAAVLGTVLFNFGFVTTIPSWVNEKKPGVSVNKSVWIATTVCIFVFFLIGLPASLNYRDYLQGPATGTCKHAVEIDPHFNCANDLMSVLLNKKLQPKASNASLMLMKVSVYLFPIVAIVSSIPVFSIVIKYNCLENGWSKSSAVAWGVFFPWMVAVPLLYMPDALSQFITFSSLIFVSFTDFIVPWCLYIIMVRKQTQSMVIQPSLKDFDTGPIMEMDPTMQGDLHNVVSHFAIPERWNTSKACKIRTSLALVIFMTLLATAGTVLQVYTNIGSATSWDCADVGSA